MKTLPFRDHGEPAAVLRLKVAAIPERPRSRSSPPTAASSVPVARIFPL